jgi:hypothetical protein
MDERVQASPAKSRFCHIAREVLDQSLIIMNAVHVAGCGTISLE